MEILLHIFDWILFVLLGINVLYLAVYSAGALCRKAVLPEVPVSDYRRILVLIAAYKEDRVIFDTVNACLSQDYPSDKYDILVISDHMLPVTNARLRELPIELLQVDFEKSTNTKSLKAALSYVGEGKYDIALILDADNLVAPSYLSDINRAFAVPGVRAVQTHRVAKNLNTDMAYLDAVSEESNNTIFRLGHVNLGRSAALIGSGMAFDYDLFYEIMSKNTSLGGFDRYLELHLFFRRVKIYYLPHTYVKDEKIQKTRAFYKQRRRWLAAQYESFREFSRYFGAALRAGKWDFCDKLYQQTALPRLLLLGFIVVIALFLSLCASALSYKWWGLFVLLLMALAVAIPRKYWTWRLLRALILVPYTFLLMFINLFRLKEAKDKFIHTEHGVEE